jgi:hypothetical protein
MFRKVLVVALAAGWIGTAGAAQQFGIEVYPGAQPAPEVSKMLKDSMKVEGGTFTTADSVEKVTAFYKRQAGLKENPGSDKESSSFMGKGVMVTVQNPWMDMKTGTKKASTLVSIVKQ